MKPTVISANASSSANPSGNSEASNSVHIPINREFAPHFANAEANSSYGSPNSQARQQQPHQIPAHFQQDFGFEPDMDIDMDMFPRGRLGRLNHDPFNSGFASSRFGFPEFGSMGRRRRPAAAADAMNDDRDFFNRLPSEFRQYIPEGFGQRRGGNTTHHMPTQQQQQQQPQHYPYHGTPPNSYPGGIPPQSPSKKVCDAAIQTEDPPMPYDQVDHAQPPSANLNQHGLRNTFDMGVKTAPENEQPGARAQSAPPPEQMQQNINNGRHGTPPKQSQFGTQTSPQASTGNAYQKAYYPPQQQPHPQQKQQTPPPSSSSSSSQQQPQTPGGTYIRTIPIFVEGRSEPIINAHKEIPNQYAQPQPNTTHARQAGAGFNFPYPQQHQPEHQQQQHHPQRPTPLNTQQQQPQQPQDQQQQEQQNAEGVPPPQTPHTLDSINKIQDIQRDVLDLMGKVENFKGLRQDKEYVYLDEMLTRNLLKLDTIDTNGKESIRLARKEAIKCIQASINVLEAKAEENAKTAKEEGGAVAEQAATSNEEGINSAEVTTSNGNEKPSEQSEAVSTKQKSDAAGSVESNEPIAIPLPPPSYDEVEAATKEASPKPEDEPATTKSCDKKDSSETK